MIGVNLVTPETNCKTIEVTSTEQTKITLTPGNMREFIVIDNQDFPRILRYLIIVVAVMSLSVIVLRFAKDDRRRTAESVSQLKPAYSARFQPIDDFYDFPCFPNLISSQILKWNGKCVRTINMGAINFGIKLDERCQIVPVDKKPSICTYLPLRKNEALLINEDSRKNKKYISTMLKMLEINREMYFFDISMGYGEYCVSAAAYSNKSICMNGNYKTVIMLIKSVVMKRTHDNVRFIWNILRDKHEVVKHRLYNLDINKTSSDVNVDTFSSFVSNMDETYDVNSVTLDDLTGLFHKQPVFMRLDLDSTDVSVFLSGDRFFKLVNLSVLQIVTNDKDKAIRTAEILGYHGFLPYNDPFQKRHLKRKGNWPRNIYFMK